MNKKKRTWHTAQSSAQENNFKQKEAMAFLHLKSLQM